MKTFLICVALLSFAQIAAAENPSASAKAPPSTIEQIRERVDHSTNIPAFVRWLKQQVNVAEIDYNSTLFFTTDPPQQFVSFTVDAQRYRFLLRGDDAPHLTLTREERVK